MKKYKYLGINNTTNTCCLLTCLLPFDMLEFDNLETDDFHHDTTGLYGRDTISRTLSIKNIKKTGRTANLKEPLIFSGVDYNNNNRENYWTFEVNEIHEVRDI